jgi:hypothetical protein
MVVFVAPLVVAYVLLGCLTGGVVGRRLWGNEGSAALGIVLGLTPALVGFGVCLTLVWRFGELP